MGTYGYKPLPKHYMQILNQHDEFPNQWKMNADFKMPTTSFKKTKSTIGTYGKLGMGT